MIHEKLGICIMKNTNVGGGENGVGGKKREKKGKKTEKITLKW